MLTRLVRERGKRKEEKDARFADSSILIRPRPKLKTPRPSSNLLWLVGNRRSDTLSSPWSVVSSPLWLVGNRRSDTHIFPCMLAYYVQWHMTEAWRPLLFADEDQESKAMRDPVMPAERSDAALQKVHTKRLDDDSIVHSFRTLLDDVRPFGRGILLGAVEVDGLRAGYLRRSRCPDLLIARHSRSPSATLRPIPITPGSEICCKNGIFPISQMSAKSGGTS